MAPVSREGFIARAASRVGMAARALDYRFRSLTERLRFRRCAQVHELPPIYHYWSNRYLRPKLQLLGATHPEAFFLQSILDGLRDGDDRPRRYLSIGAGDCAIEIGLARDLAQRGGPPFVFECLDVNKGVLERGRRRAEVEGVAEHITPRITDLNRWHPDGGYDMVIANQSLHHIVGLENLFDGVARALSPNGLFIVSDMIGRNGHMRWPEALAIVDEFWSELPDRHRYNRQRRRQEHRYRNVDYSTAGFEGVRAQDILPLLVERFSFDAFAGFANVVDPFIDRCFGPNFSVDDEWDRAFIDRVHARDEAALRSGEIKPTHMLAAMCVGREGQQRYVDGRSPRQSIRVPG